MMSFKLLICFSYSFLDIGSPLIDFSDLVCQLLYLVLTYGTLFVISVRVFLYFNCNLVVFSSIKFVKPMFPEVSVSDMDMTLRSRHGYDAPILQIYEKIYKN